MEPPESSPPKTSGMRAGLRHMLMRKRPEGELSPPGPGGLKEHARREPLAAWKKNRRERIRFRIRDERAIVGKAYPPIARDRVSDLVPTAAKVLEHRVDFLVIHFDERPPLRPAFRIARGETEACRLALHGDAPKAGVVVFFPHPKIGVREEDASIAQQLDLWIAMNRFNGIERIVDSNGLRKRRLRTFSRLSKRGIDAPCKRMETDESDCRAIPAPRDTRRPLVLPWVVSRFLEWLECADRAEAQPAIV